VNYQLLELGWNPSEHPLRTLPKCEARATIRGRQVPEARQGSQHQLHAALVLFAAL
jgi:hypothetical protein